MINIKYKNGTIISLQTEGDFINFAIGAFDENEDWTELKKPETVGEALSYIQEFCDAILEVRFGISKFKKLCLLNGSCETVATLVQGDCRTIQLYMDDKLEFSITVGSKSKHQDGVKIEKSKDVKIWNLELCLEIYRNFDQHWVYLSLQP